MVVFGREQRTLLAETLRDVANIAAGAMVFGQFLGDQEFLPEVALLGLGLWMGLVTWAIVLTRSKP